MENVRILVDGVQKDVYGLFYTYDSKYYFIYTEKELDENNYVILYMTQVGKETKNTENGPVDTGYMVGVEITNPDEQQKVQTSVSYIVEDKKNNTVNPQIQYLPMSMLINLKIVSKKRFRLLKSIMIENFKLDFGNASKNVVEPLTQVVVQPIIQPVLQSTEQLQPLSNINNNVLDSKSVNNNLSVPVDNNVIIDYRTKYFEEEEKNKELQAQIEMLRQKLEEIKKVIE